ncbi:MAG: isoprenylcysteine carboxylmethyltransferase family protein [Bacteroidota bacterium]
MVFLNYVPLISFFILLILITGRIIYLNILGTNVLSKSGKTRITTTIMYLVFGLIFLLFIVEMLRPVFQLSFNILPNTLTKPLAASTNLKIAGSILILFSISLLAVTLIHFNKSLRFGLHKENTGRLITTGIFSLSRNPFFVSLEMWFTGIAFILPTPFFIGLAVLAVIGIHFFILKEEKFMKSNYGHEYLQYAKKVRRYF